MLVNLINESSVLPVEIHSTKRSKYLVNLALDFLELEKVLEQTLHLNLLLPSRVLPQTTVYLDPQLIHAKR